MNAKRGLTNVKLYGDLAKKFGKVHFFVVNDSYDAIRALSANYPNFRHEFAKQGRRYMVAVNKHLVQNNDELLLPANEIRFIPVVGGAGNGVGQVLIGAALVVSSFYMPEILAGNAGIVDAAGNIGTYTGLGVSAQTASLMAGATFAFGASLALGGISKMLSQAPQTPQTQQDSRNYGFSGPVNNTNQGNPVPILYGRMIIGSQVISASIRSADIPIADSAAVLNNSVNYKGQY